MSNSKNILDNLFGSQTRVKLLKLLFRNYPGSYTAGELSRRIQESFEDTKKELTFLSKLGLTVKNKK